jgi:hypothetical protein
MKNTDIIPEEVLVTFADKHPRKLQFVLNNFYLFKMFLKLIFGSYGYEDIILNR